MRKALVVIMILIFLIAGIYFLMTSGKISNPLTKNVNGPSLGEQIYTQTQNPIEDKLPETNPFTKVNPFKNVYKNPFE